ncbi:uncharacterized protein LOC115665792 isoform X2 [Syzygium oleosum]|uniref:uncharacterized protein LOC115665792 isoform X2 n=1 Tax=Syzygium oleosum TaxID=219896 RepID=UPI0024BB7770|nr:uncharacterized protein LOC115665792 isoform X2 [Syzygium oleosum]
MEVGPPTTAPRKVMVVADPTHESAAALQYTLSHGVVERDELILLHVENPSSWRTTLSTLFKRPSYVATGNSQRGSSRGASMDQNVHGGDGGGAGGLEVDFLEEMKHACEVVQPNIRVRTARVELEGNKDKASAILSQCTSHEIDVLIVGQRRSLSTAILGRRGGSMRGTRMTDMAEYLIENSKCTCVAVQKKGQNGGYLLNTKTYRNFWLLA